VSWLLDTCVVSELVKPAPAPAVVDWLGGCAEESLFLNVLTLGEIGKGVAKLADSSTRTRLEAWLRHDLPDRFAGRILPIDQPVAAIWGTLCGEAERAGSPLPVIDSLIAATALHHGLTVVTRNTRGLERCGAACFDPWTGR